MKICLYLEYYHFLNGILYKKVGTGLLTSYQNQKATLNYLGIPFFEQWDDSCDILQVNTPWLRSIFLIKKARKLNKKVIVWSHVTAEDAKQVFRFAPIFMPLLKKYLTYAYGLADIVFCPSEYTKKLLLTYGLQERKLFVRSNGVDSSKFYEDNKKRILGKSRYGLNNLTIGTMGSVIPRKGVDTFLLMAKKFPKNQFIWFGKIYSSLLVKSLPKNLPKNVKFTGYVDDINEAYNSIDIFIFPSYEENQGMAILEAAAVGLPIIVRDIPVYNGWLINGENCLKAKSNEDFGILLNSLINDLNLRQELGRKAKLLGQKESIKFLAGNLKTAYERLLN